MGAQSRTARRKRFWLSTNGSALRRMRPSLIAPTRTFTACPRHAKHGIITGLHKPKKPRMIGWKPNDSIVAERQRGAPLSAEIPRAQAVGHDTARPHHRLGRPVALVVAHRLDATERPYCRDQSTRR